MPTVILNKNPLMSAYRTPAEAAQNNPPEPSPNDLQRNSICNSCKYGMVLLSQCRWEPRKSPELQIKCCHPALHQEIDVFGVTSCNAHEDGEFSPPREEEDYMNWHSEIHKALDKDKTLDELLDELEAEEAIVFDDEDVEDVEKALDGNEDDDDLSTDPDDPDDAVVEGVSKAEGEYEDGEDEEKQ
jgi:hypothetical protein